MDGKLDLAVGNAATNTVTILLGNGDGTFKQSSEMSGSSVAVADFNADGIPDLAIDGTKLLGVGNGTFTQPTQGPATGETATATVSGIAIAGSGTHSIVASYSGDASYVSSVSTSTQLTATTQAATPVFAPGSGTYTTPQSVSIADASPGVSIYYTTDGTTPTPNSPRYTGPITISKPTTLQAIAYGGNYSISGVATSIYSVNVQTTTNLLITAGGSAASSVKQGMLVTLTASVTSGSVPVKTGLVIFCNAAAPNCTDINQLGAAQLTSAGTATLQFRPAVGNHSYKAVYLGTPHGGTTYAGSFSADVVLDVSSTATTTTTIAQSGYAGAYTLTATVAGSGLSVAPTGTVSFLDTSNGNAPLGTVSLGTGGQGLKLVNVSNPAAGNNPTSVVTGDFNGDGEPDLAVANPNEGITILLGNGDGTFTPSPANVAVSHPISIAIGDFNADDKLDLAVTYSEYVDNVGIVGTFNILYGNGDGTFTSAGTPCCSGFNGTIAVADFNADGIPDLALGNDNGTVTILGVYPGPQSPATGGYPVSIAVGDFNRDGVPDLAVGNSGGTNPVMVLLGNGDGTFTPAPISLATGTNASSIAVGDFNADGKLDLAVADNSSNTVTILLGNGDGTFTPAPQISATWVNPSSIAVGDFNADGKLDLAVANNSNTVTILLGNGDGTFTATAVGPANGNQPSSLAIGDFNGDGVPDLAVANFNGNVSILTTSLTETASATVTGIAVAGSGTHTIVASYAGDSDYARSISSATPLSATVPATPPVFTPGSGTYTTPQSVTITDALPGVSIYYTTDGTTPTPGSTKYTGPITVPASVRLKAIAWGGNYGPSPVASANYTIITTTSTLTVSGSDPYTMTCNVVGPAGTGISGPTGTVTFSDLTANQVLGTATLGTATTAWSFKPQTSYAVGKSPMGMAYGDFNNDGKIDVATVNTSDNTVSVLVGNGDGTFQPQTIFRVGNAPGGIVAADLNGDGKLDLAVTNASDGTVSILLGNGDGTFAQQINDGVGKSPQGIAVADFNGDGKPDLAVTNQNDGTVSILLGNGDGTFKKQFTLPVGKSPLGITAGAFTGSGKPQDLVVVNSADNTLSVLLGKGDGTFSAQSVIADQIGTAPVSIAAADFNRDGKLDVDITSNGTITVLLGNGDGTFQYSPTLVASVLFSPLGMAVGDFNSDGILDLAVTNSNGSTALILTGNGDGTFQSQNSYVVGKSPGVIAAADLNGDGKLDLVNVNSGDNTISVLVDFLAASTTAQLTNVTVNAGTTAAHALQCSYGGDPNYAASVSNAVTETYSRAAAPVFSLLVGNYPASQPVSITAGTPGALIYYTTDGSTPTPASTLYSGPFNVSSSIKLRAIDAPVGYTQSAISEVTYNIAAVPVISFSNAATAPTATMTDTTPGAVIRYTTDGSAPSKNSTVYNSPLTVTPTTRINAFATAPNYINSPVASASISNATIPTISITPSSTSISKAQALSVAVTVSGSAGNPTGMVTLSGAGYTSAAQALVSGTYTFVIPTNSLSAGTDVLTVTYSGDSSYVSGTGTATVTVTVPTASTPTFSVAPGTYTSAQTVAISDSTQGATIYYTTGGTTPTQASTKYIGPITLSSTETINAIAAASGYATSAVASATYTISAPTEFSLSASPSSLSVAQGGSGTSTITVAAGGGVAGAVSLSASGLPTGVTASFAPGSAAGTQVLTLSVSASAQVTSSPLAVTITGTSGSLTAATSVAFTITAEPGFTAGSGGTTSMTLAPGSTTGNTGMINVVGTNGFTGIVNLTCKVTTSMSNVNDMPTCNLNPTSVTISGTTAQTTTLTVTTTTSKAENRIRNLFWPSAGGTALAALLFFVVPRGRRNWVTAVGLFLLVASTGLIGCGGGSGSFAGSGNGGGNTGTTPGAYTITVTGNSGTVSATVGTVMLTVQ
jgi:hypothetical protein